MLNKFLKENKVSKMTKAERNAWYNSLTRPQKAIAICEDVLLQISNEKYVMTSGVYAELELNSNITQRTVNDIFKKTQLDDLVAAKSVTCNVCAMGSAFMSAVRLGNNVESECALDYSIDSLVEKGWGPGNCYLFNPGDSRQVDSYLIDTKLLEAFTEREFRAMEFMFEDHDVCGTFFGSNRTILQKAADNKYYTLSEKEKMTMMCKQIIKDKGYFFIKGVNLENTNK